MNHEYCGKECVGLKCKDECIVYPGGVARSTPELIRAYERGANRTLLLEEALLASDDDDYELPDELVDRLFMRPSGEASNRHGTACITIPIQAALRLVITRPKYSTLAVLV